MAAGRSTSCPTRFGMGRSGNNQPSLPLVMLISASENNARLGLTRELVEQEAAGALFVSAIPGFLVGAPVPAYAKDAWFGKSPAALPRTLVVHGTLDPNTAYAGALEHAAVLGKAGEVSFSTVEGGAHLLSYFAPGCFVEAVGAFVEGGEVGLCCLRSAVTPTPLPVAGEGLGSCGFGLIRRPDTLLVLSGLPATWAPASTAAHPRTAAPTACRMAQTDAAVLRGCRRL